MVVNIATSTLPILIAAAPEARDLEFGAGEIGPLLARYLLQVIDTDSVCLDTPKNCASQEGKEGKAFLAGGGKGDKERLEGGN